VFKTLKFLRPRVADRSRIREIRKFTEKWRKPGCSLLSFRAGRVEQAKSGELAAVIAPAFSRLVLFGDEDACSLFAQMAEQKTLKGDQWTMADTGEDREIKARLEAHETETFRESQRLSSKTREANQRRRPKLKRVVDPNLFPPGMIPKPRRP